MKVATPEQMREIDRCTINEIGIPGIVLMENAALSVIAEAVKTLGVVSGKKIIVFAGKGNNGGDALAVSRHLFNKGADIKVYLTSGKPEAATDARLNFDILENMGVKMVEIVRKSQFGALKQIMTQTDLIVDGIFGTGLNGDVEGAAGHLIDIVNQSEKPVISIDIPSGINGGTGKIQGKCIKAAKTVTFGLPKTGIVQHPGCEFTGELIVSDIGIPEKVINSANIKVNLIERKDAVKYIPKRLSNSNKADFGRVFIISGSVGMTGAGCLTAGAALRTGAGLVYLGVPAMLTSIYDACLTEVITIPLEDEGKGYLSKASIDKVLEQMKRMAVIAVGPGLSINEDIVGIVGSIIHKSSVPLVLDADALNAVAADVSVLSRLKTQAVITPHPGEMARLMGISNNEVQNNRIETALQFARKWKIITVLKGARTVIAAPDGTVYINHTGNPGMATGGTGDVLTGIIAGLISQGAKPLEAAVSGVYIHGLSGDNIAGKIGEHSLVAGDLTETLPFVIKKMVSESAGYGGF